MFKKNSKKIFLFGLTIIFLFLFFLPRVTVKAETWSEMFDTTRACPCAPENTAEKQYVRMQLNIPGITEKPCTYDKTVYGNNKIGTQKVNCYYVEANLPDFIRKVYNFSIGIIAIFAVMVTMIGGLRWILSGGNPGQIKAAQDSIKAAVSGLVLVLLSYTILNLINPKLTNLELTQSTNIEKVESGAVNQCKNLADNTTVIVNNEEVVIRKDGQGENIPAVSTKLADLKCEMGYAIKDKYYAPNSSTNKLCYGEKCDKGICIAQEIGNYACLNVQWAGNISWPSGGTNNWVTNIELMWACRGSWEYSNYPLQESYGMYGIQTAKSKTYGLVNEVQVADLKTSNLCGNMNNALFFLRIIVQRGGLQNDDDYYIDKHCQLIKGPDGSQDRPSSIKTKDVDIGRLATWNELLKGNINCNINIDETYINR